MTEIFLNISFDIGSICNKAAENDWILVKFGYARIIKRPIKAKSKFIPSFNFSLPLKYKIVIKTEKTIKNSNMYFIELV